MELDNTVHALDSAGNPHIGPMRPSGYNPTVLFPDPETPMTTIAARSSIDGSTTGTAVMAGRRLWC